MSFLKNIKPNKPTASLEGYFISMLAPSKFGKTTFAIDLAKKFYGNLDKTLLLATEIGYKTMADVFAINITGFDYADDEDDEEQKGFVETVDELIENKNDIPFRFIIIDTITALEKYAISHAIRVANREDSPQKRYTDISDIPWGKGYNMTADLVYNQIDRLKKAGFGVYVIGHSKTKKIKNKDGFEYDYTTFNVLGKTSDIIEREADMIIFGDLSVTKGEDGKPIEERLLRFRSDGNILAGTRFRNFPSVIPNDVDEFLGAFEKAVLGLYDNDDKAVKEAQKEQAEVAEKKSEKAIEKEAEKIDDKNEAESLKEEIMEYVKDMNKTDKLQVGKIFKSKIGTPDFRESDDLELLKEAFELVKKI